jgi:hypothetical protein
MDCDHLVRRCRILSKLLNVQRSTKQSKRSSRRSRNEISNAIEGSVEIREKRMASPPSGVRNMGIGIQRGHGTFGRAKMPLARVHVVIGIIGEWKNRRLPGEGMAAPETGRGASIRRRPCPSQHLLHGLGGKSLRGVGRLHISKNLRVFSRPSSGLGSPLINGKPEGKDNRCVGHRFLGRHCETFSSLSVSFAEKRTRGGLPQSHLPWTSQPSTASTRIANTF